jgi:hemerythrin
MSGSIVKWDDSYLVGIEIIDDQHKRLLEAINALSRGLSDSKQEKDKIFRRTAQGLCCVCYRAFLD